MEGWGRGANARPGRVQDAIVRDVQLLVTELVTNAVLHIGSAARLRISAVEGRVRMAVEDNSPSPPVQSKAAPEARPGRGLLMLGLTDWRGGVTTTVGKSVWPGAVSGRDRCWSVLALVVVRRVGPCSAG